MDPSIRWPGPQIPIGILPGLLGWTAYLSLAGDPDPPCKSRGVGEVGVGVGEREKPLGPYDPEGRGDRERWRADRLDPRSLGGLVPSAQLWNQPSSNGKLLP